MQRILLVLALFVLLMSGRHKDPTPPVQSGPLPISIRPLSLSEAEPTRDMFGPLRLTGAWELTSPREVFGGISALTVRPDGWLIGLSDSGELFELPHEGEVGGRVRALPRAPEEQDWPRWRMDSESLTYDPHSGRYWVGFEHLQRICGYAPDFAALEGCVTPAPLQDWPKTGSIESLLRIGEGRFLAIAEMAVNRSGAFQVLLWQGDPVSPGAAPPVRLSYRAPSGYRPTDALWLGGDRLLVLNRRLTAAEGFTARISLVRIPSLRSGIELKGAVVARLEAPAPADNFEALALGWEGRQPVMWVASDDNRFFFQRTLLLRFALPRDWVTDGVEG
jgi:hypothetical protein